MSFARFLLNFNGGLSKNFCEKPVFPNFLFPIGFEFTARYDKIYLLLVISRDELETIQAFASELSVEDWVCSEFQMLNRPLAPVLIFLFKR